MQFKYPVVLNFYSEDEVVVQFQDFPEVISSGASKKMALKNAIDALDEAIAGRMNRNEDIPEPSKGLASYYIPASLQIALKAVLYIQIKKNNISKVQLAKLLECDEKVARRLLDPKYNTPLKKIEDALRMLDLQLSLDVKKFSDEELSEKSEWTLIIPPIRVVQHTPYERDVNNDESISTAYGSQDFTNVCKPTIIPIYPDSNVRH